MAVWTVGWRVGWRAIRNSKSVTGYSIEYLIGSLFMGLPETMVVQLADALVVTWGSL